VPRPRGRLFKKYVVVLLVLVGGVLMASSLVELYFSYRETQLAIVRVERAKAVAAASGREFLKEVEGSGDDPDRVRRPTQPGRQGGLGFAIKRRRAQRVDFLRVAQRPRSAS
jgi:hypothetical protein